MPGASYITCTISSARRTSLPSMSVTSGVLALRTGSPKMRISCVGVMLAIAPPGYRRRPSSVLVRDSQRIPGCGASVRTSGEVRAEVVGGPGADGGQRLAHDPVQHRAVVGEAAVGGDGPRDAVALVHHHFARA